MTEEDHRRTHRRYSPALKARAEAILREGRSLGAAMIVLRDCLNALEGWEDLGPLGAAICDHHQEELPAYTEEGYRLPDFCAQCRFDEMRRSGQ